MGFRFVTISVLAPIMAMSARKGLDRTLCRLIPWIGKILGYIPDSLFVPFAASLLSAFAPVLLDLMAEPAMAQPTKARYGCGLVKRPHCSSPMKQLQQCAVWRKKQQRYSPVRRYFAPPLLSGHSQRFR